MLPLITEDGEKAAYSTENNVFKIINSKGRKLLTFENSEIVNVEGNNLIKFKENDMDSVVYIPDEFLGYDRQDGDAKTSHIQEEERILYVAKTRVEDELILSSIVKGSSESVNVALEDNTLENIKAINKISISFDFI